MKQVKNTPNPLMVLACRNQPSILSIRARARMEKKSKQPATRKHFQSVTPHKRGRNR
jgi:hypothetical protein